MPYGRRDYHGGGEGVRHPVFNPARPEPKVDWWNNAIVVALILAFVVSGGVVFTTWMAFRRAKQLATAQDELGVAREHEFSLQLREANRKADEAKLDLGKERTKRLDMEASLAPRWLDQSHLEGLRKFSGTQVVLEYVIDAEARKAAGQIRFALRQAGWNIVHDNVVLELNTAPVGGVTIQSYKGPVVASPVEGAQQLKDEENARSAAESLESFLTAQKWNARATPGRIGELQPNTLKMMVDLKPSPYFLPKEVKDAMSILNKVEADANRRRQEMQKRHQNLLDQIQKMKPPQ